MPRHAKLTPLTPEQQALAADPANLQYAAALAGRAARKASPGRREELRSAAMYGLVAAARLYDPARGVPFGAFLALCVRGAISHYRRDLRLCGFRHPHRTPRARPPAVYELKCAAGLWAPAAPDREPGTDAAELVTVLARRLPPEVRRPFVEAAAHDTRHAAARALGISRTRLSQRLEEARAILREYAAEREAAGRPLF